MRISDWSSDVCSSDLNLADDEPVHRNRIIEWGCALLGAPLPPLQSLDDAGLSPAARAFYSENRRVANGKAKRLLGWKPRYPSYREGLRAAHALSHANAPRGDRKRFVWGKAVSVRQDHGGRR